MARAVKPILIPPPLQFQQLEKGAGPFPTPGSAGLGAGPGQARGSQQEAQGDV